MGKRIIPILLTLLTLAATYFVSRLITTEYDLAYRYTLASFFIAEIFLGTAFTALMKTDEKAMPMQTIFLVISVLYLLFVAITAVSCAGSCLPGTLLIIHIIGLFVTILLFGISKMAYRNTIEVNNDIQKSTELKKIMTLEITRISGEKSQMFSKDKKLGRKIEEIEDSIRVLSDSIPCCKDADEKILSEIKELEKTTNIDEAISVAEKILVSIECRQKVIKASR